MDLLAIVDNITVWLTENCSFISVTVVAVGGILANIRELKLKAALKTTLDKLSSNGAVITTADAKIATLEAKIDSLETTIQKVGQIVYAGFLNSGIKNKNDLAKIWNNVKDAPVKETISEVKQVIENVQGISNTVAKTIETVKTLTLPKIETNPYIEAAKNKYGK
jgi:prefoldin subunit 5